jgi:hypothetical protein
MRMYELWKLPQPSGRPVRLEDASGAVLFPRICEAEQYSRTEEGFWECSFAVVPVRVGLA